MSWRKQVVAASLTLTCLGALPWPAAGAQRPDTLRLPALQASAAARDPRARELDLLASQSRLRQENFSSEQRPVLTVESQAQYQSDVAHLSIALPGGITIPVPPHDTYDAHLVAQQKLYDPTLAPRRAVENAQTVEAQARLRASLFLMRQSVNDAFFASLRAQFQMAELRATLTDLEAQHQLAAIRVREGSALPSEELALRAELIRRRQSMAELVASRRASLEVLSDFTGQPADSTVTLGAPDLARDVAVARSGMPTLRVRPEYQQFAASRDLLQRQEDARSAEDKPRVSIFARTGYGRPGLNPLATQFDSYWLAAVQFQWSPWTWGTGTRDEEVLALQRQAVTTDERYFTDNLRRGVAQDLATIDRLSVVDAGDDEIVALRDQIAAETRARFTEGTVTAAEYVDRQTDVLSARLDRANHHVELAQARAHFLTTLGIEVR